MNPKRTIDAVIFDMDGVLLDSEPIHLESTNMILAGHGGSLSKAANDEFIGWNERAYWTALALRFGLPGPIEAYIRRRQDLMLDLLKRRLPIADGVRDVLRDFADRGVPLAVASSSQRAVIEHVLAAGGLSDRFGAIASGDEVKRSKPDPEIFLLAAARLAAPPERCLVFEDAPHGARGALAAGMLCARVMTETTRGMAFPAVDMVVETFVGLDVDRVLAMERTRS